jgi:hypothetical protein
MAALPRAQARLLLDTMILASVFETIPLVSHELSGSQACGTTRRTAMDSVLSFVSFPLQELLTEFPENADSPYCLVRQYWANDDTTPVTIPLFSATYFEHCLCLVCNENLAG